MYAKVRRALIHQKGIVIGQTVYDKKTFLKFTLLNPNLNPNLLSALIKTIKELARTV